MFLRHPRTAAHRLPAQRGFTLLELLAVLAMMSVLVVTASPTFVRLMRDRRVSRASMQIVDLLRTARTRAIGHGQPVLLRYLASGIIAGQPDATAGKGALQVWEPIVTSFGTTTNCLTTVWFSNTTQVLWTFDIQNGAYSYTDITMQDDTGTTQATFDFCFSVTGKMYTRSATNPTFSLELGVPSFNVFNLQNNPKPHTTGLKRTVFAPPDGDARVAL